MKSPFFTRVTRNHPIPRLLTAAVLALFVCLPGLVRAATPTAGPFVYVVTESSQFGIADLATGAFRQIGRKTPDGQANLVWLNGSLLSLTFSGNLERIDPATGQTTVIGATGLGPNVFDLAKAGGKLYLTDFDNNIYTVNPTTGWATILNDDTGIPPFPAAPFSMNPDGTINLGDESFYGVGNTLYVTFDAFTLDPKTLAETADSCCGPTLYQINRNTGTATPVGPTTLGIGATVEINGTFYGFRWAVTALSAIGPLIRNQLLTLDLATGKATPVTSNVGPAFVYIDAAAGGIVGAAPLPPGSPFPHI